MTATFGKLEHETLTLEPGLNLLYAPNEWGKSTWCTFLLSMLYGVETRGKKGTLSHREHYTPWSGSPMSGRIDLEWQGRYITIERSTRGRVPMGFFRAYETGTGIPVPELDGESCGQTLLGVERSVFQRAGFILLGDLPVSPDEALRSRLNALVTTGDESGDAARLEQGLRELKNRCRYHRSGQLPKAEQEREQLNGAIALWHTLQDQEKTLLNQIEAETKKQHALENHRAVLFYEAALRDAQQVSQAEEALERAHAQLTQAQTLCSTLPPEPQVREQLKQLQEFEERVQALRRQSLPEPPEMPELPKAFLGMEPEEAVVQAHRDALLAESLPGGLLPLVGGVVSWAVGAALLYFTQWIPGGICGALGTILLTLGFVQRYSRRKERRTLAQRYGTSDPAQWEAMAAQYRNGKQRYQDALTDYRKHRAALVQEGEALKALREQYFGEQSPKERWEHCQSTLSGWKQLREAEVIFARAQEQQLTLQSMARTVPPKPEQADSLTLTREETRQALHASRDAQRRCEQELGQCRGRMTALGDGADLERQRDALELRIRALEKMDAALILAQDTLADATRELQRRFAPRITQRAQSLMQQMTGGRYDRMTIDRDFSLLAGAQSEDTLHEALWRSEGTIDQLYLALRLSTAEALTPDAPLILDDALARFDETRLQAVLAILQDMAKTRQVVVFSCRKLEI